MESYRVMVLLSALVSIVKGHGGVSNYTVGSVWYRGYAPYDPPEEQLDQPWLVQRSWDSNWPVFDPQNSSIVCNAPGTAAPSSIPIQAGQNITAIYYSWLHSIGPMIIWMSACSTVANPGGDCRTFDASAEKSWFKIGEYGLLDGNLATGLWFQQQWQKWDGSPNEWTVAIPKNLLPGEYLIRHEIISLHVENKPQWYAECAHLKIDGQGTKLPKDEYLARIPGVWSMDQPEININVYAEENQNVTTYKIPGPSVWGDTME